MPRSLAFWCILSVLAGCSAGTTLGPAASGPETGLTPQHPDRSVSWMSPQAKAAGALLYISDYQNDAVYTYSYPKGTYLGKLTGFNRPYGQCVDAKGNVYIANSAGQSVIEYAHGGTSPIATFKTTGYPIGCAVAPNGDLAVANFETPGSGDGDVAIFTSPSGTPSTYSNAACFFMLPPAYDAKGNLFLQCLSRSSASSVVYLPAGGSSLDTIAFDHTITYAGGVAWDGKYVVLTDQEFGGSNAAGFYQAALHGTKLQAAGSTTLSDDCSGTYLDFVQPFVVGKKNTPVNRKQGTTVIAGNSNCAKRLDIWAYPAGGAPTKTLNPLGASGESVSLK